MDGENNGAPYEQMDDLGIPLFLVQHPSVVLWYIELAHLCVEEAVATHWTMNS